MFKPLYINYNYIFFRMLLGAFSNRFLKYPKSTNANQGKYFKLLVEKFHWNEDLPC